MNVVEWVVLAVVVAGIIIAVNGFHGEFPYSASDVHDALAVSPNVPIVTCDARERRSTKSTLITLVEHAMTMQMSTTR